jgi:predicted RNA binding protein with dsRBD fold (UPF0201 family)
LIVTRISATINPTESHEKVAKAVIKLFGDIELDISEYQITAQLEGLESLATLRSRIASDKIRSTLERVFQRWVEDDRLSFGLNRQAAHAGHVSINLQNEDPMGPIHIVVEGDLAEVITFLTR